MGKIYTNIKLTNDRDIGLAEHHHIGEEEIRKIEVNALVDSGCDLLVINDAVQKQLGLEKIKRKLGQLADGSIDYYDIVGPVQLEVLGNRLIITTAMVIPNADEILLGAIPMQELDVQLDMLKEELILPPDRPNYAMMSVK